MRSVLLLPLLLLSACEVFSGLTGERRYREPSMAPDGGAGTSGASKARMRNRPDASAGTGSTSPAIDGGTTGSGGAGSLAEASTTEVDGSGAGGQRPFDGGADAADGSGYRHSAPSCKGMRGDECSGADCCASAVVPGGPFTMGREGLGIPSDESPEHQVNITRFGLDTYEVTVGRFRRFVDAYDGSYPQSEAGAHPNIPGSGWQTRWNTMLPKDRDALIASLSCQDRPGFATWSTDSTAGDAMPVNCIDWYVALAFCIWDGGRLPTEAEWEFAGADGDWRAPWPWGFIDPAPDLAIMDCAAGGTPGTCGPGDLRNVGSRPAGRSRFGLLDLAGSVAEPTIDTYLSDFYGLPEASGTDVACLRGDDYRVYRGGGFNDAAQDCRAAARNIVVPTYVSTTRGVRCARGPW